MTQVSGQAPAHIGLANACAMEFEMTRSDTPDLAALERAFRHAREACRLDSQYGEAWATLGFVLDRMGQHDEAVAASRRAVALEPDNWRHHLRLADASWGEERLREARRTLALLPGLPLAHWLAASVHVARQATAEAERELAAGVSAQAHSAAPSRFSGVALHWLTGLIHLSRDQDGPARDAFERELSHEGSGHVYARECCANTWYAIGALEWRRGRRDAARAAFEETVRRLPLHPLASVALAVVSAGPEAGLAGPTDGVASFSQGADPARAAVVDQAFARAVRLAMSGTADARGAAAALVERALAGAPRSSAGWLLPLEPLLHVASDPDRWAPALARVRNRAA